MNECDDDDDDSDVMDSVYFSLIYAFFLRRFYFFSVTRRQLQLTVNLNKISSSDIFTSLCFYLQTYHSTICHMSLQL